MKNQISFSKVFMIILARKEELLYNNRCWIRGQCKKNYYIEFEILEDINNEIDNKLFCEVNH